jgi:hypothetical protein
MDHKPSHNFRIFILEETTTFVLKNYLLVDTDKFFETKEAALEWIENEGSTQLDYTIIEVYRKR